MQVEVFKKKVQYTDSKGERKKGVRLYVKCNDELIPIEVSYFGNDEKKDKQYSYRRAILSSFATVLPEKDTAKQS